jgi:hypothetical protein
MDIQPKKNKNRRDAQTYVRSTTKKTKGENLIEKEKKKVT